MPGVVVSTSVRTGPTAVQVAPASTFFVAGFTEKGEAATPKLIRSYADFLDQFGDAVNYSSLPATVKTFFEEGGIRAYVSRLVGPSATVGTVTLDDADSDPTLTLTAVSPGAWSTKLAAQVIELDASTVRLAVRYDGKLIFTSRSHTSNNALAAEVNAAIRLKYFVTATALTDAVPDEAASTALSAGVDDRNAVNADSNRVAALENFGYELGTGVVSIPGHSGTTIWDGLIAHASTYRRIAFAAFDSSDTITEAKNAAAAYATDANADHIGFFYPWVTVPGSLPGATIDVPPEGYAAAARARAHAQVGPWRPGAGLLSQARWVTAPATLLTKAQGDDLDGARINAIRVIAGTTRIYGARSASEDELNFRYITARDTMNFIVGEAERRLEDYVFSAIDSRGALFGLLSGTLIALLDPMSKAGGLYSLVSEDGTTLDPGYSVLVDNVLNPPEQIAAGLVKAKIGVRISSVGDQIELIVTKSDLTSAI